MYLKNYKKDEKYIKKAFNMRISLLQQDKNHAAIARSLDNLGWCLMLRHQYKRRRRKNLNMLEYLAKCTEKALQKGKCRQGKQINAFISVSVNTIQLTRTSIRLYVVSVETKISIKSDKKNALVTSGVYAQENFAYNGIKLELKA